MVGVKSKPLMGKLPLSSRNKVFNHEYDKLRDVVWRGEVHNFLKILFNSLNLKGDHRKHLTALRFTKWTPIETFTYLQKWAVEAVRVDGGDNIRFIHANDINGLQPLKMLLTDSLHNAVNVEGRAPGSSHISVLLSVIAIFDECMPLSVHHDHAIHLHNIYQNNAHEWRYLLVIIFRF